MARRFTFADWGKQYGAYDFEIAQERVEEHASAWLSDPGSHPYASPHFGRLIGTGPGAIPFVMELARKDRGTWEHVLAIWTESLSKARELVDVAVILAKYNEAALSPKENGGG